MIVFLTLAILFIACTLIALVNRSEKWADRFLIGFVVFIFAALLYMFIKQ